MDGKAVQLQPVIHKPIAQTPGDGLLQAALEAAEREGAKAVYLEVAEDNVAARRLYASHGFEEAGRRRAYYPRAGAGAVDALVLRRALNTAS